jgi:hypothetical protein
MATEDERKRLKREKGTLLGHLPDFDYTFGKQLIIAAPAGTACLEVFSFPVQAELKTARASTGPRGLGWYSLSHGRKDPAVTAYVDISANLPIRFITVLALGKYGKTYCAPPNL